MTDAASADLTNLSAVLKKAGKNAPAAMDTWMEMVGTQIEQTMKTMAPVKTGRLRNSIRVTSAPGRVQVGPVDVDYDVYQEYGTSRMKAQPFARPAFTEVMTKALPHAAELGVKLIVAP